MFIFSKYLKILVYSLRSIVFGAVLGFLSILKLNSSLANPLANSNQSTRPSNCYKIAPNFKVVIIGEHEYRQKNYIKKSRKTKHIRKLSSKKPNKNKNRPC